jgi:hypothetical protein
VFLGTRRDDRSRNILTIVFIASGLNRPDLPAIGCVVEGATGTSFLDFFVHDPNIARVHRRVEAWELSFSAAGLG